MVNAMCNMAAVWMTMLHSMRLLEQFSCEVVVLNSSSEWHVPLLATSCTHPIVPFRCDTPQPNIRFAYCLTFQKPLTPEWMRVGMLDHVLFQYHHSEGMSLV